MSIHSQNSGILTHAKLNPFQQLRKKPTRTSSDGLIRTEESYSFRQARRFRKDRPLDDSQAQTRLENGDSVVVSEHRKAFDADGVLIASETAESTLNSTRQLAAFARINSGSPRGSLEELAAKVDQLQFQPLDGGRIVKLRGEVYDRASWEGFGTNFSKELGPRSDAWTAGHATDGFVSIMDGDVDLRARADTYNSITGGWVRGEEHQVGRRELSGEIGYDYDQEIWLNADGSPLETW